MRKLLLLAIICTMGTCYAQEQVQGSDPFDGTYQIILEDVKRQPSFSSDFNKRVESMRKDSEDVTVDIMPGVKVFIPSCEKINSSTFQPLELYSY